MKNKWTSLLAIAMLAILVVPGHTSDKTIPDYPAINPGYQTYNLHGERVPNPFAWLPESKGLNRWLSAQSSMFGTEMVNNPYAKTIAEREDELLKLGSLT